MGTVYKPIFVQDGQYLTFENGESSSSITLGQVVMLDTSNAGKVKIGTAAGKANAIGVAVATRATSAMLGDSDYDEVAVGAKLSVITWGIVWVTASGSISIGDSVECANSGAVAQGTTNVIGTALTAASDGEDVKILLRRRW